MKKIFYFDIKNAIQIHDTIIKISGGLQGVKNDELIHSVLAFIQDDVYYVTFEEKMTHLVYSIIKNHSFNDGNKRTSIALGAYFLKLNDFDYCINDFMQEMENICVYVAINAISKKLLQKLITSIINEYEYDEALKLEYYISIQGLTK